MLKKSKQKIEVVFKRAQPQGQERNVCCTCGKVYKNPQYTLQYATCPFHSPKDNSP